jgi:aspartyl-tRNA(Asn)/glutamyl-tRNA(Gln) amidotransferase subunit A
MTSSHRPLNDSPLSDRSLAAYAADLRNGAVSAVATTRALLDRIALLEPRLGAFTCVDVERAMAHASAIDGLLRARVDLGPLMGVPVVLKDLYSVAGMPTGAGSRIDVSDLVAPQGSFVTALQRAGCVLLGKTATVEFALGGYNLTHRLPWNPCDPEVPRMTGGSSHGSAVAMAAGLCGFSVGGDTGGSVRWPAALCGVVGFKTTASRWAGDGIFPLSPQMDSVGYFTASAADAAFIEAALSGQAPASVPDPASITLALPAHHFFENLDSEVAACFDVALQRLRQAGIRIVGRDAQEAGEIDEVFRALVPADLLAFLGRERVVRGLPDMDPVAAERASAAFDVSADRYLRLSARRRELEALMRDRSVGLDAWVSPTVPMLPGPTSDYRSVEQVAAWNRRATQNTRPGNLFNQCGVSLPIQHLGAALPVGLQLCAPAGRDAALLATARAIESVLGVPPRADAGRLLAVDVR